MSKWELSSRGEAVAIQEKVSLDCFANARNDKITHKKDQIFCFLILKPLYLR